uniref:Uncharacterized protein n=1 Tax=viral metagenome TaxID=1070528 RepID=A0A6M3JGF9_9ZZZZ
MTEELKGLYRKYIVTKTSGKPLVDGWDGIILRIDGGRYVEACRAGATAFAEAVKEENPKLYKDIKARIWAYEMKELGDELEKESRKLGR